MYRKSDERLRMNPRERILKAIRSEPVDRIPWVPFVGCHGASLIGVSAKEYHQSEDLLVSAADEAIKQYQPDGLP